MKTGVIIGRFQVPYLHAGQHSLLARAFKDCDHVIIFVGVSVVRDSKRNPLDYSTREQLLRASISEKHQTRLTIMPLPDMPSDHSWSKNVDQRIGEVVTKGSVTLYGGRDSFAKHYHGRYAITEIDEVVGQSGTILRDAVATEVLSTNDFRAGQIYYSQRMYPRVHATVDILVHNYATHQVLLGRKPGEVAWRIIGGFADPKDDNFEDTARRECQEETGGAYNVDGVLTGGVVCGEIIYIQSFKVNDWRYANEPNKIVTTFFAGEYLSGEAKASDDLEEVRWFDVASLVAGTVNINPTHQMLIDAFLKTL